MNTKRTVTNIVKKCEDDQSSDLISVATYNILADCHIHHWRDTLYAHIPDEDLFKRSGERSNRHLLLLKEVHEIANIAHTKPSPGYLGHVENLLLCVVDLRYVVLLTI